jgi:hypothetical protein
MKLRQLQQQILKAILGFKLESYFDIFFVHLPTQKLRTKCRNLTLFGLLWFRNKRSSSKRSESSHESIDELYFPDVADEVWKEQLRNALHWIFSVILFTNLYKEYWKKFWWLNHLWFWKLTTQYFLFIYIQSSGHFIRYNSAKYRSVWAWFGHDSIGYWW